MIVRYNEALHQYTFHDSLGHQIGPTMGQARYNEFLRQCLRHQPRPEYRTAPIRAHAGYPGLILKGCFFGLFYGLLLFAATEVLR
jgi:hypothetical protein